MTIRLRSLLVVLALASSFAVVSARPESASAAAPVLYAATGAGGGTGNGTPSSLYTLDASTGAATKIADITIGGTQVRHVAGLAVHPATGVLYGFMNCQDLNCTDYAEGTLITIDKATGAATVVGTPGGAALQSPDMSFFPLGTLYAWNEDDDDLYTIDTGTGTATRVGESGLNTFQTGLAFDAKGKLYLKNSDILQRLDRTTGTPVGSALTLTPSGDYHNMLAFGPSDTLYTGTRSGGGFALKTINRTTGAVTTLGSNTVTNISALAWDFGTPSGTADLSITKTVDDDAPDPETAVTFTVTVSNAGPDTATGVVVKDLLPSGFTYVSDDSGGDYDSGTGLWDVGSIANGSAAALEITATYHASGSHTNIAEVIEADTFDPDSIPGSGEGDTFTSVSIVPTLYAATGAGGGGVPNGTPSSLYTLDASTGAATKIADITIGGTQVRHVAGLAVHPATGVLYGFMNCQDPNCTDYAEGTLITIDKATGAATVVGTPGGAALQSPDMSFFPLGTLYAWNEDDDDLYTIDTGTGTATRVGESGLNTFQTGLAFDAKGKLYLKNSDILQRLDRTTGTPVGSALTLTPSGDYHNMLAFGPSDTLYTGTRSGGGFALKTINRTTGAVTTLGSNTVTNISALAWDFGTPSGTADLSITKTVDDDAPDPETAVTFTVTVSNAGPDTATGVVVKDLLPSGFTYVSDDSGGDYDSGTGIWDVGSIANGNSATLEITATYHASGSHTNVAEVVEAETFDPDSIPGSGEGDTYSAVSLAPTLYAATGAGGGASGCGSTLSSLYAIDAATGAATKIADITIGGTQVKHVSGLAVDPTTGTLYGFMNNQQSDCSDFGEGTLLTIDKATGAATIVGSQGAANIQVPDMSFDPFGTLYAFGICEPETCQYDLYTLDKANGTSARVGECFCNAGQFGLAVDSKGKMYLKPGDSLDRLNQFTGTDFESIPLSPSGTYHNMLAFGPSDTLYTGTRSNTVFTLKTINRSTGAVTTVGSNAVTNISALAWDLGTYTPPPVADLSIDKSVDNDAPSDFFTNVTFTITIANDGPDTATGVVGYDPIPSGFSYVSDDGGGAYDSGTGIWTVGSIANGGTATLHIVMTVLPSGSHTNAAEVLEADTYDPDSVPSSVEGDAVDTQAVTPAADPNVDAHADVIVKGATLASVDAQKFSVVVINAGETPLPLSPGDIEVTVNDNAGVVSCKPFDPTTVKSGSSKKMSCTANIAALGLAPGNSVTYAAVVDVPNDGFTANDTDTVFRTLAADKDTPPTTLDAHADVIVKGATLASEDAQKFSVVVINAGDAPLPLSPGDIEVTVNDDASVISCNAFKPATVKSGSSKKVKCTANVAGLGLQPGDTVTYRATVGVASDGHAANDTDSVFRILS